MSNTICFKRKTLFGVVLGLLVLALLIIIGFSLRREFKPQAAVDHPTYLLSYGVSNGATPSFIAQNIKTIEQNYPYDGEGLQLSGVSGSVMRSTPVSYSTIKTALQPLFDMSTKPAKLKHSLVTVYLHDPGDMFTDAGWNVAAQNFANLAQVIKELKDSGVGVDGILFDNEGPYDPEPSGFWNYGNSTYFRTSHTLAEYQTQTALRGKQVMQAMVQKFPDLRFMVMHSSDISCTDHPWYSSNETIGSFNVGLMEGTVGTNARFVDGGEEAYGYTTESQFINSYNFRKTGIVNHQPQCSFIPTADRSIWSQWTNIGFGLYNGYQTSSTIGNAAKYALMHSDNFVWFYVERVTTIGNTSFGYPQIGQDWTNALAAARIAIPNPTSSPSPPSSSSSSPIQKSPSPSPVSPSPTSPSPSPVSPSPSPTACEPTAPKNLIAKAVSTSEIDLSWTDSTGENGYIVQQSIDGINFSQIGNTYAPDVTTWQDKKLSTNTKYYYRVQGYNGCGIGLSTWSNVASATTQADQSNLPAAPSNLIAKAVNSSTINLSWTDNSTNENGFAIERSTSSSSGFVQIAYIWSNMTTYKDSGLARKTTYYYRVRAFNANGNSAYTNIASARTKTWWIF